MNRPLQPKKALCLQLHKLPKQATTAYCVPNIHNNLKAISKLCDARCDVTFNTNGAIMQYEGVLVLQGQQDMPSYLWWVPSNIQWASHYNSLTIQSSTFHMLTTLSTISTNTYRTVKEHSNYISSIMPPFSLQQKQPSLRPLKEGYLQECPRLTYQSQNGTLHTMKLPQ